MIRAAGFVLFRQGLHDRTETCVAFGTKVAARRM
jgi:hypothetical protein